MQKSIEMHYKEFLSDIKDEADKYLNKELPELSFDEFLIYEKTGNRLIYEEKYFERRKCLAVYGFVFIFFKQGKYLDKLEYVLNEICEERTWALPAHVNREEATWENTIDLFAAETAQALACIYDMHKKELSPEIREKLKDNIIKRVLLPYQSSVYGTQRFEKMRNNWVAVCLGCIGSAVMFLGNMKEVDTKAILDRVLHFIPNYLGGISDDGVCTEGLSYFTYGMVYYLGFAEQIKRYSGGKIKLLSDEKLQKLVKFQQNCYLPGGSTVSFSDGERYAGFRMGLSVFLKENFTGVSIPDINLAMNFHNDHCYRFMANFQDIFWVGEYLKRHENIQNQNIENIKDEFIFYEKAEWAIRKKKYLGIAIKGGHNDEDHNHNDVGSFLVSAEGEIYLSDLGCGEYTKDYFGKKRYEFLCTRSLGHNVPLINNKEQKAGKEYRATYFKSPSEAVVKLCFASAYEYNPNFILTREFCSDKDGEEFTLCDTLVSEGDTKLTENFVTQIEPIIIKRQETVGADERNREVVAKYEVHLNTKKGSLIISGIFSPVTLRREVFKNHKGKKEAVWLISFPVNKKGNTAECLLSFTYERRKKDANGKQFKNV